MRDNQKWIKELHDFFVKDENWDIACDTVKAVSEIETYWKQLFWGNVLEQCYELFDEKMWKVFDYEDQVDIHPINDKYKHMEHCCVTIKCDEVDGCWYGIWSDLKRNHKKIAEFSEGIRLSSGDELWFKPRVHPYLDAAQLGMDAKQNFEGAKELAKQTGKFIEEYKIRDFLLNLK